MAFSSSGFEDDGLPQLNTLDQLDQLWKQASGFPPNTFSGAAQPCSTGHTMANPGEENNVADGPFAEETDYEATPDLELKVKIYYQNNTVKSTMGSLNPLRPVRQLKARLATQLKLEPDLVEMSWSKKGSDGGQSPPVVMEDDRNLMYYEVETDDTIIIRELPLI